MSRYRSNSSSFIQDLIAFEEWMESKEKKDKDKKDRDKPKGRSLSFAEGMLVAFMVQWYILPMVTVYLKSHGLQ